MTNNVLFLMITTGILCVVVGQSIWLLPVTRVSVTECWTIGRLNSCWLKERNTDLADSDEVVTVSGAASR